MPVDVDATVTVAAINPPVSPPCAVEYQDSAGVVTHLATVAASRAVLTDVLSALRERRAIGISTPNAHKLLTGLEGSPGRSAARPAAGDGVSP